MADCCITDDTSVRVCPACGLPGLTVGTAPVRTHQAWAADGAWCHCPTSGCGVVFHLDGDIVTESQVRSRVGRKAITAPEPVCFCFGHTAADLAEDLATNQGTSTINAAIKAEVARGSCACEHLNPDGSCCLGAVGRILKSVRGAGLETAVSETAAESR